VIPSVDSPAVERGGCATSGTFSRAALAPFCGSRAHRVPYDYPASVPCLPGITAPGYSGIAFPLAISVGQASPGGPNPLPIPQDAALWVDLE